MKRAGIVFLFLLTASLLWPQGQPPNTAEFSSLVGITLADLLEHYGPPKTVSAARGNELWQDDVIFQYDDRDFYIHKDRVWQVRVASAHGISVGDPKQAAVLTLGNNAVDMGDHLLLPAVGSAWPIMLRVNFNNAGRVSAIFIYRTDY